MKWGTLATVGKWIWKALIAANDAGAIDINELDGFGKKGQRPPDDTQRPAHR